MDAASFSRKIFSPSRSSSLDMKAVGKIALARGLEVLLGRRHLYRLGRFLLNYARLDLQNDMEINGELYVQQVALQNAASSPLVCFDVGANVGLWSKALLQQADSKSIAAQVHAFEPCTETFAALSKNLNGNGCAGKFVAVRKACSDHIGRATLNIVQPGCCGVNSIVTESRFPVQAREEVELTSIDAYCREASVTWIRLLKIDAEGHDLAVIKGAAEMLRRKAIDIIQFEYNQSWIEARSFLRDAFETVQTFGYELGKVTRRGVEFYQGWAVELETFVEGNYIACTPAWRQRFQQVEPAWLTQTQTQSSEQPSADSKSSAQAGA
jgi:FkbM family methyltransferase